MGRLIVFIVLLLIQEGFAILLSPTPRKQPSEMLLPIHSTTALMCEVVFSSDAKNNNAVWYRNGKEIGTVSRDTNAIFENRNYTAEQPVPEVGFLIMSNISKDDEGLYWCRHADTGTVGEVFSLTVAYVDEIPSDKHIKVEPSHPLLGEQLTLVCPLPNAVPQPTIEWLLNGEPVAHSSSDAHSYPNGTLFIRHFSILHNGVYECVVSNFAARTSSRAVVESKQMTNHGFLESSTSGTKCSLLFKSSVLWFLVGCLMSSSSVLIYLLCVLVLMRPIPRATIIPSMWARSNPLLGPGFRKPIVPVPDFITGASASSHSGVVRNYEDV